MNQSGLCSVFARFIVKTLDTLTCLIHIYYAIYLKSYMSIQVKDKNC